MLASTNINQSAPNFMKIYMTLYDLKVLDECDYYCPSSRVGVFDLVYTQASICIYDAKLKIFV